MWLSERLLGFSFTVVVFGDFAESEASKGETTMTNIKRNFETPSGLLAQIEQRCASSRFAAPSASGFAPWSR